MPNTINNTHDIRLVPKEAPGKPGLVSNAFRSFQDANGLVSGKGETKFTIDDIHFTNSQRDRVAPAQVEDKISNSEANDRLNGLSNKNVETVYLNYTGNKRRMPPILKINEVQMEFIYSWVNTLKNTGFLAATAAGVGSSVVAGGFRWAANLVGSESQEDKDNAKMNSIFAARSDRENLLDAPINLLKTYFAGNKVIASYEIPYGGENFLEADGTKGWNLNGEGNNRIAKKFQEIVQAQLPVDMPMMPEWNRDASDRGPSITTKFSLINDNITHLAKNFKFLHAFGQGPFWVQHGMAMISPPNVYNVEFPGYFEYYFSSAKIKITNVGLKRRLSKTSKDIFLNIIGGKEMKGISENNGDGTSISGDIVFPDIYEVEVEFQPLFPHNFNTYINYLIKGKDSKILRGNQIESDWMKLG